MVKGGWEYKYVHGGKDISEKCNGLVYNAIYV